MIERQIFPGIALRQALAGVADDPIKDICLLVVLVIQRYVNGAESVRLAFLTSGFTGSLVFHATSSSLSRARPGSRLLNALNLAVVALPHTAKAKF